MQHVTFRNHEYLNALVCGLSRRNRKNRLFCMLISYADDSGTIREGPVFILAGFVARIDPWRDFSDEWQNVLDDPLGNGLQRLAYFKMSEAMNQTGCFIGWPEPDCHNVVMRMASIIPKRVLYGIRVTIGAGDFQEVQQQYPYHPIHPYELLFNYVMLKCITHKKGLNIEDKIKFIFDDQNDDGEYARTRFLSAFDSLPLELTSHIAGKPEFQDDKEVLPLQGADLFAWLLRRYHYDSNIKGERIADTEVHPALDILLGVQQVTKDLIGQEIYAEFDRAKCRFPSGFIRPRI